jgi:YD repeat-containing protein
VRINTVFLLALALFLWGCPAEEDPAPALTCQLNTMQVSGNAFPFFFKYTFNSQNQLTQISSADTSGTSIYLSYDAQGRLVREKEDIISYVNEYNHQNQLVKQTRTFAFAPGRAEVFYYLHDYNNAGELTESRFYSADAPTYVLKHYKYSYEGSLITKVEKKDYSVNGPTEDITYTYDGKKQPLSFLPMILLYGHLGDDHPAIGRAGGNVTSCTIMDRATGIKSQLSYTVNYTYTPEDYPKEAVITSGNGTKKFTYEYSCR